MVKIDIIVDGHEDLAWNMLTFGRDYTLPVKKTRQLEHDTNIPKAVGDTLISWDAYQRGKVAVVFSTLFASPMRNKRDDWDILCYQNAENAHQLYRDQLDAYHRLADDHPDKFSLIQTSGDLQIVLEDWEQTPMGDSGGHPVGMVILMEAAEGICSVSELEEWWSLGLRIIGPAWKGTRYCGGTGEPGPLTKEGYALLDGMAEVGFTLDLSHMDEKAALQALDYFPRRIIVSHGNAKALLKGTRSNRHLSDRLIRGIIEREGVIGVVPFNKFLQMGWSRSDGRESVSLVRVVDHIDYICQLAGDSKHIAIGTDFDGCLGLQDVPVEIDTIADMQKIKPLLFDKNYSEDDVSAIMGGNWLSLLIDTLP